jgi:hypothetical protein
MSASPFPGMDPYLEDPDIWQSIHLMVVASTAAVLNRVLPSPYVAVVEEWLRVLPSRKRIRPDATVDVDPKRDRSGGGIAVLERTSVSADEPLIVQAVEDVPRQRFLNIVRGRDEGEVVTTIECLSHSNKSPGKDRHAYIRKQKAICHTNTHLIEIDLLRAGTPTLAVPIERLDDVPFDYLTCLHRGGTGPRYEVWPTTIRQPLPKISVPLEDGVPDVTLDLQAVLNRAYDDGAFSRILNYRSEPIPPLSQEDADWADKLLKKKGLW